MWNNSTAAPTLSFRKCEIGFREVSLVFLYVLVMILGVVGNVTIFYIFGFRNKQRKSVTELLIVYLAAFDFLGSIFGPIIFMYWIVTCHQSWHFGLAGCKILPFLSRVFINISLGIILILSFDRYRAICSPFRGQLSKTFIHASIAASVVIATITEYHYLEALTLKNGSVMRGCMVIPSDRTAYIKISSAMLLIRDLLFLSCFTITTVAIACAIRKRDLYFTTKKNKKRREMSRVVRVIIVMEVVFLLLVLPRDVLHLYFNLSWLGGQGVSYTKETLNLNEFLKVFQTANCCANVFIYAKLHDRFRSSFFEFLWSCLFCRSRAPTMEQQKMRKACLVNSPVIYKRQLLKKQKSQYTRQLLVRRFDSTINQNTEMLYVRYDENDAETPETSVTIEKL